MGQNSDFDPALPTPAGRSARALDEVDRHIISLLVQDGRISIRTLAERVHVSRSNAYARLQRLIADGVISGFQARIVPERAGLGTSAYVGLTIRQNTWREVSASLARIRYLEHAALVGADYDVLALVRAPDNATLRDVVLNQLQRIPGVLSTRTWLVFEEFDGLGTPWS
ncbi:MAG TPA: Lrp/AsnC family transcriptional regulator [Micromonosporaceae bacterium]